MFKKEQKSRFLIRIEPYQIGGSTTENELKSSLNRLLNDESSVLNPLNTNGTNKNNKTFKIAYKRRNHDVSLRLVVNKLANLVSDNYNVNLSKPDVAILLNVVKGTSFLSILPNYTTLKEYNFRKIK